MEFWRVPLDADTIQVSLGIVHILEDRCKGCGYCIEYCPKQALEFSTNFNQKGYHPPVVVKPEECVNCHYCEIICPEFAIFSVEALRITEPGPAGTTHNFAIKGRQETNETSSAYR